MTDLLTRDPNESDEFPLGVGETLTRIVPADLRDPGEATEELGKYFRPDAPFPHLRQQIDATTGFRMPDTIGVVDTAPIPMPRPSVPPQPQPAPAPTPNAEWERVIDPEDTVSRWLPGFQADVDGELFQAPLPRPATPITLPKPNPKYVGRHRRSSWFTPLVEVWATVYARLWGAL